MGIRVNVYIVKFFHPQKCVRVFFDENGSIDVIIKEVTLWMINGDRRRYSHIMNLGKFTFFFFLWFESDS